MIQRFINTSAHGVLALASEIMFDAVPENEDDGKDGDGNDEPPFQRWVLRKRGNVHAEETDGEGQGQETSLVSLDSRWDRWLGVTYMNVIQLNRHILKPNCKECRASLIPTLLYMRSDRAVVGRITSLSHCPVSLSSSSGTEPSQGWSDDSFGSAPARS